MRRWILGICVLLACSSAVPALAATILSEKDWQALKSLARSGSLGIAVGASVPATCAVGELYFDTSIPGSARLLICVATDAWVEVLTEASVGVLGWPTNSSDKMVTWANAFVNALAIGNGSDYWVFYRDPTMGLQFNCVIAGVENDCNYGRKLSTGKYFEITNNAGSSIFRVTESTGAITNMTLNTEGSGNAITMQEEVWWDVAACQSTTAALVWDYATTNSPAATCDTGSNTQKAYAAFDDTTDESFETNWVLPTGFTGSIDIKFVWKAAATSGAVGWCAQLIRVPDGSTSDPAYPAQGSANCVSDTAKGTTLQENLATITGVTCTSCTAGDHVYVRISRDANGGAVTDSMTGDAFLLKFGRVWRVAK